jgi:hypothetical protein
MTECVNGTLNLHGVVPSQAEIEKFVNILFHEHERGIDHKLSELLQLVYQVTRTSGLTIYQEGELTPAVAAGRDFGAGLDTLTNTWVIVVPRGKEYYGAMAALHFIIEQG